VNTLDVIDTLAGLKPDSPLALIRDRKPVTREHAQASYAALFAPADPGDVTLQERFAVASFIAGLHAQDEISAFYTTGLARTGPSTAFLTAIKTETENGRTTGPYGAYPKGPLSAENVPGPLYAVAAPHRATLGPRLTAALAHVHLLVFHPRDANPAGLQALLDAGWSNTAIVTLSQLTAFLAFQIRAVAGLRALASA
jgi:CMD domain protein